MNKDERWRKRIAQTMFKEMICSPHGAACFLEAKRRDKAKERKKGAPHGR